MSGQVTGWVLRYGPKDRAMRMVLVTIADAANRDGEHAHPGMAAMCEGSLYSPSHVRATVAKLIADGWVEVEANGLGGRGMATVYRVVMETRQPVARLEVETRQSENGKRANPEPETRQSGQGTLSSAAVEPTTERLTTPTPDGVASLIEDEDPERTRGKGHDYRFDDLWEASPARNGKRVERRKAHDHWVKLSYRDKRAAFAGIRHYRHACDAPGGPLAKDLFRWLQGRCWEDWQTPAVVGVNGNGQRASPRWDEPMTDAEFYAAMRGLTEAERLSAEAVRVQAQRNRERDGHG